MVNVRATMLDDADWFTPFVETRTRDKLPWASTPAQRSFAELPAMEEWPKLVAEFAAR